MKGQFQELKTAFQQITGLGKDFQGKGADAIKQFYRAQANVVDTWLDLIDQQIVYYRSIPGAINKKHLDEQASVQVPFLEDDLATGYYRSKEMITQQREAIGKILSRISNLVPLTVFSNRAVDQAEDKRRKMVTDVRDLDQHLNAEYQKATEGLPCK
ncbi:T7SS effector LXG polymorphic toxin [Sporolactobacillus shoreae]|uniref:T7SS effector LXG polymorphic toxin n=1 Tax=Sporolactobacillus shoreae TaxID=1465501 RepID=UPI003BAC286B